MIIIIISSDLIPFTLQPRPGRKAELSSGKHQELVLPDPKVTSEQVCGAFRQQFRVAKPFHSAGELGAQHTLHSSGRWGLASSLLTPGTCPCQEDALVGRSRLFLLHMSTSPKPGCRARLHTGTRLCPTRARDVVGTSSSTAEHQSQTRAAP